VGIQCLLKFQSERSNRQRSFALQTSAFAWRKMILLMMTRALRTIPSLRARPFLHFSPLSGKLEAVMCPASAALSFCQMRCRIAMSGSHPGTMAEDRTYAASSSVSSWMPGGCRIDSKKPRAPDIDASRVNA
jgi:hypothetical protein